MVRQRNDGIDLLRIIAMYFVVILHALKHGGVLETVGFGSFQYSISWALEIIAYPAVDIFALITGYVSFSQTREKSLSKTLAGYITTWLQVVYYCLLITMVLWFVNPEWVTIHDFLNAFFPVTNNMYWYFTAYTGVIILSPLVNAGIQQFSNKTTCCVLVGVMLVFSLYDTFPMRFNLNSGYSVIWLLLLYIIGASMRKISLGERLSKGVCFLIIIAIYAITWCWKMFMVDVEIMTFYVTSNSLFSYTSPTVVCVSILYVILFSKIKASHISSKIIQLLAPGAFSVYLLNDNILVRAHCISGKFQSLAFLGGGHLFLVIVLFAFVFTVLALIVDKPRQFVFNKVLIKRRLEKIAARILG